MCLSAGDRAWDNRGVVTRRIRLAGVEHLFCDERQLPPSDGRLLSAAELRAVFATHGSSPQIRSLLGELEGARPEQLRHRSARGPERPSTWVLEALRCYEIRPVVPQVSGEILLSKLPDIPAFTPSEMFDETRHWIEIQLVGEDDEAIAGVPCEITLPSGKLVRRTTDRFGLVRVEGITSAGECGVSFPSLDQDAWEPV